MFKKTTLLILISSFLFSAYTIFADEVSTSSSSLKSRIENITTYPGTLSYKFKRLFEKISGGLLFFNDSKLNYEKKLLNIRFSELQLIAAAKNLEEVQRSSERFAYQAGIVTDVAQNSSQAEKEKVLNIFKNYRDDLEKIKFYFDMDSGFWILILHDINTLDLLTARLR